MTAMTTRTATTRMIEVWLFPFFPVRYRSDDMRWGGGLHFLYNDLLCQRKSDQSFNSCPGTEGRTTWTKFAVTAFNSLCSK